jgi:hypothetical protein
MATISSDLSARFAAEEVAGLGRRFGGALQDNPAGAEILELALARVREVVLAAGAELGLTGLGRGRFRHGLVERGEQAAEAGASLRCALDAPERLSAAGAHDVYAPVPAAEEARLVLSTVDDERGRGTG